MALNRSKTRNRDNISGEISSNLPSANKSRSTYLVTENMQDDHSVGDCKSFLVDRYENHGGVMNGVRGPINGWTYNVENWPCIRLNEFSTGNNKLLFAHADLPTLNYGQLAAELLAKTNPSRPDIDLPVFLVELKDIPQLIKVVGDNLIKTVAKSNLAYHFGWKPLVNDLQSIFNFSGLVERRYRELKKLYSSGLRRTVTLGRDSTNFKGRETLIWNESGLGSVIIRTDGNTERRYWGHCKWKPTTLPPRSDAEMFSLARRAVLGLYLNPAAAWELIPFSWMADWFGSIGAYLNASRNLIPASPYDICIMERKLTTVSSSVKAGYEPVSGLSLSPQWGTHETLRREPSSPTISASLPWLTLRQWSILASLSVVKGGSFTHR